MHSGSYSSCLAYVHVYYLANGAMTLQARKSMKVSTGRRPMASLRSSLACPPAEDLHTSQGDIPNNAHRRAKQRCKVWYLGTWNMRSLVDIEGTVETAKLSSEKNESEDRRIDLVIRELNRCDIKVAALQETKWFGNHVYHVGKSIVLTAGRETPQGSQPRQREGVAIVLTGHAVTAWKAGGKQWKSWGSRIIKAALGGDNKKTSRVHILSCYAPTFAACRIAKDSFFDDLQQGDAGDAKVICTHEFSGDRDFSKWVEGAVFPPHSSLASD